MKSKGTYKKGMGLKQVIKEAKKSWHSVKKGGADDSSVEEPVVESPSEAPVSVGSRRKGRKTVRRRKH